MHIDEHHFHEECSLVFIWGGHDYFICHLSQMCVKEIWIILKEISLYLNPKYKYSLQVFCQMEISQNIIQSLH